MRYRHAIILFLLLAAISAHSQTPKLWIYGFKALPEYADERLSLDGELYLQERLEVICDTLISKKGISIQCRASESLKLGSKPKPGKIFDAALTASDFIIRSTYRFDSTNYGLTTRFEVYDGTLIEVRKFNVPYIKVKKNRMVSELDIRKVAYRIAADLYLKVLNKPFSIEHLNMNWVYEGPVNPLVAMCVNEVKTWMAGISSIDPEIQFVDGNARYTATVQVQELPGKKFEMRIIVLDNLLHESWVDRTATFTTENTTPISQLKEQVFQEILAINN